MGTLTLDNYYSVRIAKLIVNGLTSYTAASLKCLEIIRPENYTHSGAFPPNFLKVLFVSYGR